MERPATGPRPSRLGDFKASFEQEWPFRGTHQLQSLRNDANDFFALKFGNYPRNGFDSEPKKSAMSLRDIGNGTKFASAPLRPIRARHLMMNSASLSSAVPRASRSM